MVGPGVLWGDIVLCQDPAVDEVSYHSPLEGEGRPAELSKVNCDIYRYGNLSFSYLIILTVGQGEQDLRPVRIHRPGQRGGRFQDQCSADPELMLWGVWVQR